MDGGDRHRALGGDAPEHVEHYVWVVTRHEIDYKGNIREGESVSAETFIPDPRMARGLTGGSIFATAGKVIVAARSTWAMLDKEALRLNRVTADRRPFAPEGGWVSPQPRRHRIPADQRQQRAHIRPVIHARDRLAQRQEQRLALAARGLLQGAGQRGPGGIGPIQPFGHRGGLIRKARVSASGAGVPPGR
jgi:acyl-CoA thioester hydrolase